MHKTDKIDVIEYRQTRITKSTSVKKLKSTIASKVHNRNNQKDQDKQELRSKAEREIRKFTFRIDVREDCDIAYVLDRIPQSLRGSYFKLVIRLGLNNEVDTDIYDGLPDLCDPYMRFELVKAGLRCLIQSRQKKP